MSPHRPRGVVVAASATGRRVGRVSIGRIERAFPRRALAAVDLLRRIDALVVQGCLAERATGAGNALLVGDSATRTSAGTNSLKHTTAPARGRLVKEQISEQGVVWVNGCRTEDLTM
jgi:hypothetical protein